MHASQMSLHLGDCESLLTNSAELAYLFMDLLSVVSDIVNSFSTHFAFSRGVCFMLTTRMIQHVFHPCNSVSTYRAFILLDTAVC